MVASACVVALGWIRSGKIKTFRRRRKYGNWFVVRGEGEKKNKDGGPFSCSGGWVMVVELFTETENGRGQQNIFVVAVIQIMNSFNIAAVTCPVGNFLGGIWIYSYVGNSEDRDSLDMYIWESSACKRIFEERL